MVASRVILLVGLLPAVSALGRGPTVPPDERIAAKLERVLVGPAEQPLGMPTDVGVDSAGRVYVADGTNDRVVRFTPQGKFDRAIRKLGERKLSRPMGLTVDRRDRLWIADSGNHRVVVLGPDGKDAEAIDLPNADGGRPFDPTDVAVTPNGTAAYIVDNDNHRIAKRRNDDGSVRMLGGFGRDVGKLRWPFMICSDLRGGAYVVEAVGARVQRIDAKEQWSGPIGQWGVRLGRLYRPKGVATDQSGRVFVSDSTLGVVQVFDADGPLQGVLTDRDGKPLRFAHPMGMCFDRQGRLYVVELGADRVAVIALRAAPRPSTKESN